MVASLYETPMCYEQRSLCMFHLTLLVLKMMKEDNLGVTNRLYLTFHESDSLCSENCKMGQKEEIYS